MDAGEAAAPFLPGIGKQDGAIAFRFRFDPNKSDLIWLVKSTPDLLDWSQILFDSRMDAHPPVPDGWSEIMMPLGSGQDPEAEGSRFLRLEIHTTGSE